MKRYRNAVRNCLCDCKFIIIINITIILSRHIIIMSLDRCTTAGQNLPPMSSIPPDPEQPEAKR